MSLESHLVDACVVPLEWRRLAGGTDALAPPCQLALGVFYVHREGRRAGSDGGDGGGEEAPASRHSSPRSRSHPVPPPRRAPCARRPCVPRPPARGLGPDHEGGWRAARRRGLGPGSGGSDGEILAATFALGDSVARDGYGVRAGDPSATGGSAGVGLGRVWRRGEAHWCGGHESSERSVPASNLGGVGAAGAEAD